MNRISVPYGDTELTATIDDNIPVEIVGAGERTIPEKSIETIINEAMDAPIGTKQLEKLVSPDDKVAVVVNDHTRPGPNVQIMHAIMARLERARVPDANITVVIATGSHRQSSPMEIEQIIGPEYVRRLRVVNHDCRDEASIEYIGTTSSNLPVYINRAVSQSTFCILTGLIAPHHSAGYSGGRKSILPGVAGMQSLRIHHSFPIRPAEPVMGWIEGNPFHLTALEAAKMAPVRFIVNLIQNPYKDFVGAVAGDLELAHSKGVELCRRISEVKINGRADTIIVSPGGFPRDRDLYQSQKALSVAELLGTDTCSFIIAAECRDGIGNQTFMQWMLEGSSPEEIMDRFKATGFDAGNNKAYNFARALTKGRVIIVSDRLDPELIRAMLLEWAPDLDTALKMAAKKKKPNKILVIPRAVNVVPIID